MFDASVLLYPAAFLAGFFDAIVGGGGLIQLPAMMLWLSPSFSLIQLLGTNKLASACGTLFALRQYSKRLEIAWRELFGAAGAALLFSFIGARTAAAVDPDVLRWIVLAALVSVLVYLIKAKNLGREHAPRFDPRIRSYVGAGIGGVIGFYDGLIGPGTGSFFIFAFITVFGFGFMAASAAAKLLNLATNIAALIYFFSVGAVNLKIGAAMAICNVLGAVTGVHLAISKGNAFVRILFQVIVSVMVMRLAWGMF